MHNQLQCNDDLNICTFTLTDVKMLSDWVNKATLDQPNCFIIFDIPVATSASLGTVLKNLGNFLVSERWGDVLDWEIYVHIQIISYVGYSCTL